MADNWFDKLAAIKDSLPQGSDAEIEGIEDLRNVPTNSFCLDIILEKKGRAGKVATIITGWQGTDEDLSEFAAAMRKKLATGGSTRGGEILIQGDRRKDVVAFLNTKGYKCRII